MFTRHCCPYLAKGSSQPQLLLAMGDLNLNYFRGKSVLFLFIWSKNNPDFDNYKLNNSHCPVDEQRTDRWTNGQTKGQTDERTNGRMDKQANGRTDKRTNGRTDERTNGRMDKRMNGRMDEWTDGWTKGQ